jgi:flagellar protein FlgJ
MNISSIGSLTAGQQKADTVEPTAEQRKAARDFEAIFLRQMLSGLEKSSGLSGSGKSTGAEIFGSMMVGALADTAAEGGGIGLSELILKAMLPPSAPVKPDLTAAGASHAGVSRGATLPSASTAAPEATATGSTPEASLPIRSAPVGAPSGGLTEAPPGLMVVGRRGLAHDGVLDRGNHLGSDFEDAVSEVAGGAGMFREGGRR